MRLIGLCTILFSLVISNLASAQCNPKDFTLYEFERLSFSEALALAVIDNMEVSTEKQNNRDFNSSALIKGVPVKLNFSEMKSISEYVKKNSSLTFTKDQQANYLRTNPSIVGERMYAQCLARRTKDFDIVIPNEAYSEDEFLVTLKWTPTYPLEGRTNATAQLRIINGTADDKSLAEQTVGHEKTIMFAVKRNSRASSLQIVPVVDGRGNGTDTIIAIPPIIKLDYTMALRTWPQAGEPKFPPVCSDDGGGLCGSGAKRFKKCITAANGILLPATVTYEQQGQYPFQPVIEANNTSVCVTFGTLGVETFGKKGYSSLDDFKFSVYEVVSGSK